MPRCCLSSSSEGVRLFLRPSFSLSPGGIASLLGQRTTRGWRCCWGGGDWGLRIRLSFPFYFVAELLGVVKVMLPRYEMGQECLFPMTFASSNGIQLFFWRFLALAAERPHFFDDEWWGTRRLDREPRVADCYIWCESAWVFLAHPPSTTSIISPTATACLLS